MTWHALCAGPAMSGIATSRDRRTTLARATPGPADMRIGRDVSPAAPALKLRDLVDRVRPMPRGVVLAEFVHMVSDRPENILRYRARDPVMAAFSLRLDPDGTLALLLRQDARSRAATIALPALHPGEKVRVSYHWRPASGGTAGLLVVALPGRGIWLSTPIDDAVPLTLLDADRISASLSPGAERPSHPHCAAEQGLIFAAISDKAFPAGPLPGIDGRTVITTPQGGCPIAALKPGMEILATDGATAKVLWSGAAGVPALGSLAPHVLRAPFYGVRQDMIFAGSQCLHMTGTEVEYLFFQEEISVALADLVDHRAVALWEPAAVAVYHQVVLDRPALLQAGGAAVPPLDAGPLVNNPVLRDWSVLAAFDGIDALGLPGPTLPTLRDFEAATLRRMRAA